jgi:hypothetical protein
VNAHDPQWPPSDAGIPLRTKFRLWIAAIVADQASDVEEQHLSAIDPDSVTGEPGREYPEPPPPPLSEPHPEADPTPDGEDRAREA